LNLRPRQQLNPKIVNLMQQKINDEHTSFAMSATIAIGTCAVVSKVVVARTAQAAFKPLPSWCIRSDFLQKTSIHKAVKPF